MKTGLVNSQTNSLKGSLMIQGTTSDAGKSMLVAGICRTLKRKGISVAPFKPQNMSLNSAVTNDGGEIGRAQALQAKACGLELRTDFNPVLLKPSSDSQSQVIVNGIAVSKLNAAKFGSIKALALDSVLAAYRRLQEEFDVIIIEGAGSPAEINLRENDIANMGFAEAVNCPVVIISDIDRGGVFAHLCGTLDLLSSSEQTRVKGFVINKFRGSLSLLQEGLNWLEAKTNKAVLGVLPFINDLKLDAEDAINNKQAKVVDHSKINILVIALPRLSNHTDFEPLQANANVNFNYLRSPQEFRGADLIIIPGSKSVCDDLDWLKNIGWYINIDRHLRYGGKLLGICGGFQMLGRLIEDPECIESENKRSEGLGYLELSTQIQNRKQLKQVKGRYSLDDKTGEITGYEIHSGKSSGAGLVNYFCEIEDQNGEVYNDGCRSRDGQILGTYLHGIFENPHSAEAILSWVSGNEVSVFNWNSVRESELERLADNLEEHLDIDRLVNIIGEKNVN